MQKRLYRSVKNKKVAGVCGGIADYFNIDPTIVRVVFVLGVLLEGFGLLAYIILWIATPQESMERAYGPFNMGASKEPVNEPREDAEYTVEGEPEVKTEGETTEAGEEKTKRDYSSYVFNKDVPYSGSKSTGSIIAGSVLVIIGGLFLVKYFIHSFHVLDFFPIVFIALGASLLISSFRKS